MYFTTFDLLVEEKNKVFDLQKIETLVENNFNCVLNWFEGVKFQKSDYCTTVTEYKRSLCESPQLLYDSLLYTYASLRILSVHFNATLANYVRKHYKRRKGEVSSKLPYDCRRIEYYVIRLEL